MERDRGHRPGLEAAVGDVLRENGHGDDTLVTGYLVIAELASLTTTDDPEYAIISSDGLTPATRLGLLDIAYGKAKQRIYP